MEIGPLRVTAAHMNHPVETFGFRLEHRGQVAGLLGGHRPDRRAGRAGPRRGRAALRGVVRRAGRRRDAAAVAREPAPHRAAGGPARRAGRRRPARAHPPGAVERRGQDAGRGGPGLQRARCPSPRPDWASCSTEPGRDVRPVIHSSAMRVLVTGGAGFIGSHLTDALLARGDEVTVVDDLSSGRAARLDDRAALHKLSITDAGAAGRAGRQRQARADLPPRRADRRPRLGGGPGGRRADQRGGDRERAGGGARGRRAGAVLLHRWRPVRPGRADPFGWRTCCRCPSRRTASPSTAPSSTSACTTGCTGAGTRSCGWPTCTARGRTRRASPG